MRQIYSVLFYQNLDKTFQQTRYFLFAERNFHLKGNHYFNVKAESAMLDSDGEITTNELFRIGGYNSLRGFNEQSLLLIFMLWWNRISLFGKQSSVFDVFGQLANEKFYIETTSKLYSFGLGFNFYYRLV